MLNFVVHSIPGSPFGRSVLAMLEEKRSSYLLRPVAPHELRTDQYRTLHPFARVPVLDHDGFRLYETQAILRYLERVLPEPSLTPQDVQALARMDQAMAIHDWYLFQGVGDVIIYQRIVVPRFLGLPTDEAACAAALPAAHRAFSVLAGLLGEREFFGGNSLSLADLLIGPAMSWFAETPEWIDLTTSHANLVRWTARMDARPSFQTTHIDRLLERHAA